MNEQARPQGGEDQGPDAAETERDPGGATPGPGEQGRPARLLRSSDDRVIAGVAGGLGAYFGVDAVVFRIGFALSIFFGGLGVLAYLLLAVFVPADDDPERATDGRGRGVWRGIGLAVVGLLVVAGLFALAGAAAFAVALGWGFATGLIAIAAGALLVLVAFRGGARWLIPPAVAIALGASVAAASDVDFSGGVGERDFRPLDQASIPSAGYRLGVGQLVVDLRELEWRERAVVELQTSLGAGRTLIYVPERVCVSGETRVGAGQSTVAGERNEGIDVDEPIGAGSTVTPRLELDAEIDFGELAVVNSDTALPDRNDHDRFHEALDDAERRELRAAAARACAGR